MACCVVQMIHCFGICTFLITQVSVHENVRNRLAAGLIWRNKADLLEAKPLVAACALSLEVLKVRLGKALAILIKWKVTLPMAGTWNKMVFKVLSQPNHSMILAKQYVCMHLYTTCLCARNIVSNKIFCQKNGCSWRFLSTAAEISIFRSLLLLDEITRSNVLCEKALFSCISLTTYWLSNYELKQTVKL